MIQVKWFKEGDFDEVQKTDYFCPNCGEKTVYQSLGEGDYYEGPAHYCRACSFQFTMPGGSINESLEFKETE